MLRWKKFRALGGSFPLLDEEKAKPIMERIHGGLSVWIDHNDKTGFMTAPKSRKTTTKR